jgi:hypothetical protein
LKAKSAALLLGGFDSESRRFASLERKRNWDSTSSLAGGRSLLDSFSRKSSWLVPRHHQDTTNSK